MAQSGELSRVRQLEVEFHLTGASKHSGLVDCPTSVGCKDNGQGRVQDIPHPSLFLDRPRGSNAEGASGC